MQLRPVVVENLSQYKERGAEAPQSPTTEVVFSFVVTPAFRSRLTLQLGPHGGWLTSFRIKNLAEPAYKCWMQYYILIFVRQASKVRHSIIILSLRNSFCCWHWSRCSRFIYLSFLPHGWSSGCSLFSKNTT